MPTTRAWRQETWVTWCCNQNVIIWGTLTPSDAFQDKCKRQFAWNLIKCSIHIFSCYCVDNEGDRIFGEALNGPNMFVMMHCQCSRQEAKLRRLLDIHESNHFIRCNSMGSYDRLQCLGDKCLCVDQHTGSPASPVYNITNLSDLQADCQCC